MKKLFFTALMLTALLAVTVGTVFAGSALELYQVQNNSSGPTFTFRVVGEFSQSELESGFVQVDGGDAYPLYCAQTAPDEVVCHTSKKVAGKNVVVGFGGARFWDYVPEFVPRGAGACGGYSYPVYDANTTAPTIPTGWTQWAEICTDTVPAEVYGYYIPGAPSGWGVLYAFTLGSEPTPGDIGNGFGLPSIGPGFYQ